MKRRMLLSQTAAGKAWLEQFDGEDQLAAAELLDAMLLLDAERVASAQRAGLEELVAERHGKRGMPRRKVALYAEREIAESAVFVSELRPDKTGKLRRRAIRPSRVAPIRPRRGSARVGSEGPAAFVIAQAVERWPRTFINHPGPDIIRKQRPGTVAIVTDFIGSGSRVVSMLDKFWRVPSVRSWWSLGWIQFRVISAAGTTAGIDVVRSHRTRPEVFVRHIARTVLSAEPALAHRWRALIENYGSAGGRGAPAFGFGDSAALIAFSYRIPNNAPAIIHGIGGGWRALFEGPAPQEVEAAFAPLTPEERIANAAEEAGVVLASGTLIDDARVLLLLGGIRGRWRAGAEIELAERTGLTEPEIRAAKRRAEEQGLLGANGRLTDEGHSAMHAGLAFDRRRPDIPTNLEPYYPWSLRVPRVAPSTRRLARRP